MYLIVISLSASCRRLDQLAKIPGILQKKVLEPILSLSSKSNSQGMGVSAKLSIDRKEFHA